MRVEDQLIKTIRKFRMIEKGETVFVAVSGGRDSVTLLHLIHKLGLVWKLRLGILHVNHGLRGKASDADEAFVRGLAKRLAIPIFVDRVNVAEKAKSEGLSLEHAGREARYHFFEKMAEAKHAHKIVLGHTQDDQAETVLMRIIGGTGLQGLQAIRPKRRLNGAYLVRPLLEIPRADISAYAKEHALAYREDASNRSLKFLRNRIRLKLLPVLAKSFNPQIKRTLARLPHLLDVDLTFLEETSALFYRRLTVQKNENEIVFPKRSFLRLSPSVQYRLLGRAMRSLAEADLDFDHWNSFLELLQTERHFQFQLPRKLLASVSGASIRIRRRLPAALPFSYSVSPGDRLYLPEIDVTVSCDEAASRPNLVRKSDRSFELLDGGKLSFPLQIRNRKPGDRFQPLGQSKPLKLKGFLMNKRIPLEDRDRLPLVFSTGVLACVGGVAVSEAFKVSVPTQRFVRLSFKKGVMP